MKTSVCPQPLDYRLPGTPGPSGDLIFRWLCTRHCLGVAGAALGIAAGTAIVAMGGIMVSGAVAWLVERWAPPEVGTSAFLWTLVAYALIALPLLFRSVVRSGGEFYAQQVLNSDLFHGKPLSHGSWGYRGDVASMALHIDLLFWGPRLIVDGVRRLSGREILKGVGTLRRNTFILAHLLQASDAVRTKALRIPDEPMPDFQRALRWLDRHDYVGISADGQRVWLSSATRETLSLMLKTGPRPRSRRPIVGWGQSKLVDKPISVDIISN